MGDLDTPTEKPPVTPKGRKPRWPWIAGTACAVIVFLTLSIPINVWDGGASCTIRIRVTDNSMGYPVSGATVALMQASDYLLTENIDPAAVTDVLKRCRRLATTDERGEAFVTGQFGAGGGRSFLWRTGNLNVDGTLSISHPEYQTTQGLLQNYFQRTEFPLGTRNLDLHIFLARKPERSMGER